MLQRAPPRARYDAPEPDPADGHVDTGTAVVQARQGYRDAVAAGVRHAAALAATDAVTQAIATTRRRLRALDQRWLPRLDAELAAITLELDERGHAEDPRRRRARRREALPIHQRLCSAGLPTLAVRVRRPRG